MLVTLVCNHQPICTAMCTCFHRPRCPHECLFCSKLLDLCTSGPASSCACDMPLLDAVWSCEDFLVLHVKVLAVYRKLGLLHWCNVDLAHRPFVTCDRTNTSLLFRLSLRNLRCQPITTILTLERRESSKEPQSQAQPQAQPQASMSWNLGPPVVATAPTSENIQGLREQILGESIS